MTTLALNLAACALLAGNCLWTAEVVADPVADQVPQPVPANPLEGKQFTPTATGPMVTQCVPESQSATLGLQPGDIITAYAGHVVSTSADVVAAIKANSEQTTLIINRAQESLTFTVAAGALGIHLADVISQPVYLPVHSFQPLSHVVHHLRHRIGFTEQGNAGVSTQMIWQHLWTMTGTNNDSQVRLYKE